MSVWYEALQLLSVDYFGIVGLDISGNGLVVCRNKVIFDMEIVVCALSSTLKDMLLSCLYIEIIGIDNPKWAYKDRNSYFFKEFSLESGHISASYVFQDFFLLFCELFAKQKKIRRVY